jgi:hypothetical protein
MPSSISSPDTDGSICSSSPKKYKKLTKGYSRRRKGEPKDAKKTVAVKSSNKRKTVWMIFLWEYFCMHREKMSYHDAMLAASEIYGDKEKFKKIMGAEKPTEAQIKAGVKKLK